MTLVTRLTTKGGGQVLTAGTYECDLIWERGLSFVDEIKVRIS